MYLLGRSPFTVSSLDVYTTFKPSFPPRRALPDGNCPFLGSRGSSNRTSSSEVTWSISKLRVKNYPPWNKQQKPLKIDLWKRRFLLEATIFRGELLVLGSVPGLCVLSDEPMSSLDDHFPLPNDEQMVATGWRLSRKPVRNKMTVFLLKQIKWDYSLENYIRYIRWIPKMGVWKMIFLFKEVVFRFHVNFPGCNLLRLSYHLATQCPASFMLTCS